MKKRMKYIAAFIAGINLTACTYREPLCDQPYVEQECNSASSGMSHNTTSSPSSTNCQASEYTVRTPVEVVYKNTTYRTVYVPQTSQSISYEKRPYVAGELFNHEECASY